MFGYDYDFETGGILLNDSTPNSSKEPRPVYAGEMKLLGMDEWFGFDMQTERPYMWAESANYFYRGRLVARTRGGTLCEAPVMDYLVASDADGKPAPGLPQHTELEPVDIEGMVEKNADFMSMIEQITLKRIYDYWKRYKDKIDNFHVAFSGGKDSMVLLDLTQRALPHSAFIVIFGDTGMEFPDTYKLVDLVEQQCKREGIAFYRAASHLTPEESWRLFGPPARTIRWCCSVHKAAPQTLKLREVLGKADYRGAVFIGVRSYESLKRSKYDFEELSKKQLGQRTSYPLLDWTSGEIWQYIYTHKLPVNECYKKGNTRAGCLFCPQGEGKSETFRYLSYPDEMDKYMRIIAETTSVQDTDRYVKNGGWIGRTNGRKLAGTKVRYSERIESGELIIRVIEPTTDWREWIKTLGDVSFEYRVIDTQNGYEVHVPSEIDGTTEGRYFKQVFRKAAYCLGCRLCESNCRFGCISFDHGLKITDCRHCKQCHEINEGCWAYASLNVPSTGGTTMKKKSINVLNDHAPFQDWIDDFFTKDSGFFQDSGLGPDQESRFKRFLRSADLIDDEDNTTSFYDVIVSIGPTKEAAWGLIYTNMAYGNPQIRWYIDNLPMMETVARQTVEDILFNKEGYKGKTPGQIVRAFGRLTRTALGVPCDKEGKPHTERDALKFGTVSMEKDSIVALTRTKCNVHDGRVLLYALYRFAGACDDYYQFNLARLLNTTTESAGVTPAKLFGLGEEDMIPMLKGLSARYPDFINAGFTHGLDKVSLREDKTAADVLELFRESETQ